MRVVLDDAVNVGVLVRNLSDQEAALLRHELGMRDLREATIGYANRVANGIESGDGNPFSDGLKAPKTLNEPECRLRWMVHGFGRPSALQWYYDDGHWRDIPSVA